MNDKLDINNINLLDVLKILWNEKYKFILIVGLIVTAILYNNKTQENIYSATTEIKKISNFDTLKYIDLNTHINFYNKNNILYKSMINLDSNIVNIDQNYLHDLFAQMLEERKVFVDIIKKNNLLKREDYDNDRLYEDSVLKLASAIKIFPGDKKNNWKIRFNTKNKKEWEKFLKSLEIHTNKQINLYLKTLFKNFIKNEIKLKNYKIDYLDQKIINSNNSYKERLNREIIFLKQQAKIAKEFDIQTDINTVGKIFDININKEQLLDQNLNVNLNNYFLRGKQLIEKEIELRSNQLDKKTFSQETEILEFEKQQLISNKKIEILKDVFEKSIIMNSNDFTAAQIIYWGTTYRNLKISYTKSIMISLLIGLIVATFYILIVNAFRKNK